MEESYTKTGEDGRKVMRGEDIWMESQHRRRRKKIIGSYKIKEDDVEFYDCRGEDRRKV